LGKTKARLSMGYSGFARALEPSWGYLASSTTNTKKFTGNSANYHDTLWLGYGLTHLQT
jgi:hypothetical protein